MNKFYELIRRRVATVPVLYCFSVEHAYNDMYSSCFEKFSSKSAGLAQSVERQALTFTRHT